MFSPGDFKPSERGDIFLVGPRAAGKTSVGRLLARALAREFADTDAWLTETTGKTVAQIVAQVGWPGFRELESAALAAVSGGGRVVAGGGGLILAEANRTLMRARGLVFYLSAPAGVLAARLAAAPESGQRPSLTGLPAAEEAARVLAEREPLYREAAHWQVDATLPPERTVLEIEALVRRWSGF